MRETIPGKMLGVSEEGRRTLLDSVVNAETASELILAVKGLIISNAKVPVKSEDKYINGKAIALTDNDTRLQLAFSKDGASNRSWKYILVETFRDWTKEYLKECK